MPKFIRKNPGVENKLEQWLWLIAGVKEDKIKMAESKNEKVKKAIELMDEISSDPAAWELYDAKMMARWNYQSGMAGAKEEGLEEGIKEGKKKTSIEVAEKMLRKGININTVIEITGLSLDELKENIQNFNELVKISENK